MSKEIEEVVLLGDGVLVKKPIIEDKQGELHLPTGMGEQLLPMYECEVIKTGPGDQKPMPVEVGDLAFLPKQNQQQYAEVKFDGQTYFIISHHNILFVKRKNN
jgi:co-chaperonin GroES (HSP10)